MAINGLKRAHDLQADAARLGFDWPTPESMLGKLYEELGELRRALQAGQQANEAREELGDLLFVLVNLARRLNLEPETVLQEACNKFERRFGFVLAELERQGVTPGEASLDDMEALWDQAKQAERAGLPDPRNRTNV